MDLVSQRYPNPFLIMDQMLECGEFSDFVPAIMQKIDEEKEESLLWEFFLHKVEGKSFNEFKNGLAEENKPPETEETIKTTVTESFQIINDFRPEGSEK